MTASFAERIGALDTAPLIAPEPANPRDSSRLMVVNRGEGTLTGRVFRDIHEYLNPGDCIVLNNSRVFPAQITGKKESGGKAEMLLVRPQGKHWLALSTDIRAGHRINFEEGFSASVVDRLDSGELVLEFSGDVFEYAARHGVMPLPRYIVQKRKQEHISAHESDDPAKYQTVYARERGSIAAPTAGFHFTEELLGKIRAKGVAVVFVTLHVGWGTFRPIRSGDPSAHKMLPEVCEISQETAEAINSARARGGRIISVGTTSTRTLESMTGEDRVTRAGSMQADIFIYPPYRFRAIDALSTNFHMPDSTPLYLTAAFAGEELLVRAYEKAASEKYRFYSFGDAMLII